MKRITWIIFSLTLCLTGLSSTPQSSVNRDSTVDLYETEKNILLRRISFEKSWIENEWRLSGKSLTMQVDSLASEISRLKVHPEKRNQYLKRLQVFLSYINLNCNDEAADAEKQHRLLRFYSEILNHDKDLLPFLRQNQLLALHATRLIPDEAVAEAFLTAYMAEQPDDIFRYAAVFEDRRFALPLLEKALKNAPESARRYFAGTNAVRDLLLTSKDSLVLASFELYRKFGLRSNACILVNEIAKNRITPEAADSVAQNSEVLFDVLFRLSLKQKAPVNYSASRYMEIYSRRLLRQINHLALQPDYDFEEFLHYSNEEMFLLLAYGHDETTPKTFHTMLDLLHASNRGRQLSREVTGLLHLKDLSALLSYCVEQQLLNELLALFPEEHSGYLLAITRPRDAEKNIALPVARPENIIAQNSIHPEAANPHLLKIESKIAPVCGDKFSALCALSPVTLAASLDKMEVAPIPPPEIIEPVRIVLDEKTRKVLSMKKNILHTIQNIPSFINEPYAEEVLTYAAQREPDELLKKVDSFKGKYYSRKILERCAYYAPVSVRRYLYNPRHTVNIILQASSDPVVKEILTLHKQIGYQSKPLLLLDDLIAKRIEAKDAIAMTAESGQLFAAVVKIISRPNYVGKYSIDHEMRDFSLRFIRDINDKIAAGASQPFHSIEGFSSADLYFLMLFGRDEVFTSTFNGLFNRFLQKVPQGDGNGFFRSVNRNQFRDFVSLCSSFGRMEEFLATFSPTDKEKLLIAYTSNLESQKDDLTSVVLVVEAISNMTDNQLLALLQTNIKKEYERVKASDDQIGISLYGVLSSMIAGNAQVEEGWYKKVSRQFKITPVSSLPSSALFDTADVCVEQMYFYNDADGKSSFVNFLNTYRNQANWVIEEHNTYVRILSRKGLKVEIFANRPEYEEEGVTAINNYMKEKYLLPVVVVHRGHSFHTESTLEKIPPSAKLIFVGSCGGFYKISIALENAPEAHIISTKQIGTKTLNDAMLYALNENIRNGNDIEWNEFWDKMRGKFGNNQYFSDYIPPNKNLESIFIRAYYKMLGV